MGGTGDHTSVLAASFARLSQFGFCCAKLLNVTATEMDAASN